MNAEVPKQASDEAFLESLGALLPPVIHDLRGRLNRLVLGAESQLTQGPEDRWLRGLQVELRAIARILDESLASLRPTEGPLLDLASAALELVQLIRPLLARKGIALEERLPGVDGTAQVTADALAARRALAIALGRWIPAMRREARVQVRVLGGASPALCCSCSSWDAEAVELLPAWLVRTFASAGLSATATEDGLEVVPEAGARREG